jgi:hypothetical protein
MALVPLGNQIRSDRNRKNHQTTKSFKCLSFIVKFGAIFQQPRQDPPKLPSMGVHLADGLLVAAHEANLEIKFVEFLFFVSFLSF